MTFLASINWPGFALFTTLVLVIAMFGLSLSGHFPLEHQKPEMKGLLGRILLAATMLVIAIAAASAVGLALERLPVPVAIIGAGAALLAAPLVLQKFPDSFVDGRRGLASLAAAAAALACLAARLGS